MRNTLIAAAMLIAAGPAFATPSIDVRSQWSISLLSVPAGLTITCDGNAVSQGARQCGDRFTIDQPVMGNVSATISRSGSMMLTNTAATDTGPLLVTLDSGPFNPGGPDVGLTIDNTATQTASFASTITLFWPNDNSILTVGCSLPDFVLGHTFPGNGYVFTPTSCGLLSPDSSPFFYTADIGPGESLTLDGSITVKYAFTDVPAPSGLLVLFPALLGLTAAKWRRSARLPPDKPA